MKSTIDFNAAGIAACKLQLIEDTKINRILNLIAGEAVRQTSFILSENQKDLNRMDIDDPKYDRLMLTAKRIEAIADEMKNVSLLPSPLHRILKEEVRPNGMKIKKITVPFGVIGIIYEARPNVSFDVFSLCFKSGNACILKGGSDAEFSNRAIVGIIHQVLEDNHFDPNCCMLLPPGRESTDALLNAVDKVDLIIPRGSQDLIRFVRDRAKVPVIETGAGICHTYFDESGDKIKASEIINNAKTRRVSVCNALDCLIIHQERISDLPYICQKLSNSNVIIYADPPAFEALTGHYPPYLLFPATPGSYGVEFLDYKMSVKTVNNIQEAMEHIRLHSSKHSECIISEDNEAIELFCTGVDAACVYSNVSTAFTDGAQFGLGAEIGISTQKMHARGPMALEELTSYKWIISGEGQIRI